MAGQAVERLKRVLNREGFGPLNDIVVDATSAFTQQVIKPVTAFQQGVRDNPLISVFFAFKAGYVVGYKLGKRHNAAG